VPKAHRRNPQKFSSNEAHGLALPPLKEPLITLQSMLSFLDTAISTLSLSDLNTT